MKLVVASIDHCDGFKVYTSDGLVGWVEEPWFDTSGRECAVVVRLVDGRRGLLLADEIESVQDDDRSITIRAGGRVLKLDPWASTELPLELPKAAAPHHRAPAANAGGETSVWKSLGVMYAMLAAIAAVMVGLDIFIAYLATGSPPYH